MYVLISEAEERVEKWGEGAPEPWAPCAWEIQGKKGTFKYFLPKSGEGARNIDINICFPVIGAPLAY